MNAGNVEWYRQGTDGTIRLVRAARADQGQYQCLATNQYGVAMTNTSVLQMAELGDFSDTTTNEPYVDAGKPFTMYCQNPPTSVPAPRYSWDIADDKDAQLATTTYPVVLSSRQQIDEKGV